MGSFYFCKCPFRSPVDSDFINNQKVLFALTLTENNLSLIQRKSAIFLYMKVLTFAVLQVCTLSDLYHQSTGGHLCQKLKLPGSSFKDKTIPVRFFKH